MQQYHVTQTTMQNLHLTAYQKYTCTALTSADIKWAVSYAFHSVKPMSDKRRNRATLSADFYRPIKSVV